jgi:hypothetical protein
MANAREIAAAWSALRGDLDRRVRALARKDAGSS